MCLGVVSTVLRYVVNKIYRCDRGTSAFPFWVLGAAALGLWRPAALAWMKSDLITIALATTMVSDTFVQDDPFFPKVEDTKLLET